MHDAPDANSVRLDVWLDVSCLFRTRSEAQKAIKGGKISVNGQPAKAHRVLRPGDEIEIRRAGGHKQRLFVRQLADRHVPKPEARSFYEDVTPAPTEHERDVRRLERLYRAMNPAVRSTDKRQRRALEKLKGRS